MKNIPQRPKCFAPWIHTYVGPKGERSLCCHAKSFEDNIIDEDFNDFWNGKRLKDIRQQFLKGEIPKSYCEACINSSHAGEPPYLLYQVSQEHWESLALQTHENGYLEAHPEYLDYRLDNVCNLSCRTCNNLFSSKIENQIKKVKELKEKLEDLPKEVIKEEFQKHIDRGAIKKLYFAAGEILLTPDHWAMLEDLAERDLAKDILLDYNTNLSHRILFKEKEIETLSKFKNVSFAISLDNAGKTGEFIRDGLQWNQFIKNYEELSKVDSYNISSLDITFTLPLLLDLEPLLKFLKHYRPPFTVQTMTVGGYATFLSPLILPPNKRKSLYEKAYQQVKSFDDDIFFKPFLHFLKENIEPSTPPLVLNIFDEAIIREYNLSKLLDESFGRKSLIEFYEDHQETTEVFNFLETASKELTKKNTPKHDENYYWHRLLKDQKVSSIVLFPSPKEINKELDEILKGHSQKNILFVVSKPTFFSKLFNKDQNKYQPYNSLVSQKEYTIIETPISIPLFLARKSPLLVKTLKVIEPFLRKTVPFLSFHSLLEITTHDS